MTAAGALRLCPSCSSADSVQKGEAVWPLGWCCPACGFATASRDGLPLYAPQLADTVAGIDPSGFAILAEIESDHFWFGARTKLILGLLRKYFPEAGSFLEIGCGNGIVLSNVAQTKRWNRVVGSELHPTGIATARRRLGACAEFVQMDATNIPASNVFDVVGAYDVIEHISDDVAVLRQIHRVLRPGGGTILTVPQHPELWSYPDEIALHQRRYKVGELEHKLTACGFKIIFSTSYIALLLPMMIVNRIIGLMMAKGNQRTIDREFRISPSVNRILRRITDAEVWLTLNGVRWPYGGSRVVVAGRI